MLVLQGRQEAVIGGSFHVGVAIVGGVTECLAYLWGSRANDRSPEPIFRRLANPK